MTDVHDDRELHFDPKRTYMWLFGWCVSLIAAAMYIYSTATAHWYEVVGDEDSHGGLFYMCESDGDVVRCEEIKLVGVKAYMHFTRAFMICSCLLVLYTAWTLLVSHVVKDLANKLRTAGILIMSTVVVVLTATLLYMPLMAKEMEKNDVKIKPGHSVIIAWIGIPVALLGGALLVVEYYLLRRRFGNGYEKLKTPDLEL